MQVDAFELGVRNHLRVLVQDPVLSNDLVVRDDVANRLALELRREEREEGEEQEEAGEDEAQIDSRDRVVQGGRPEEPGHVETEDARQDEGQEHGAPEAQRNETCGSRDKQGLFTGVHGWRSSGIIRTE